MTGWKNNRSVLVLLLAAAAAVWGLFLARLSGEGVGDGERQSSGAHAAAIDSIVAAGPVSDTIAADSRYDGSFRDPFLHQLGASGTWRRPDLAASPRSGEGETPPKEKAPPPRRDPSAIRRSTLVGVIGETAMLERPDGQVRFVKRGARFAGATVRDVAADHVLVQGEQGPADTLRFDR